MKLGWPHVFLASVLVTGVTILSYFGKDTAPLIALASAILLGAGIGAGIHQQGEIKQATNGNTIRLMSLVESMSKQLALMSPPAPPLGDDPPEGQT